MLKIKAIVVRQLLGLATFVMCAFQRDLEPHVVEKHQSNNTDSDQTKKYKGRSNGEKPRLDRGFFVLK